MPPPWPQLFDQPPLPNCLSQHQFLSVSGPVKWQNLSMAPDERIYHLRIADVTSAPPRNRQQNKKYFDFVPLPPPGPNCLSQSQFLSVLDRSSGKIYLRPLTNAFITCESPSSRRRPLEIDNRTKSTSILFLCHPPDQIASPEVNSCPFWTGQVAKSI